MTTLGTDDRGGGLRTVTRVPAGAAALSDWAASCCCLQRRRSRLRRIRHADGRDQVDRSRVIVFGEVVSVGPGPDGRVRTTDYLFSVEEVLKGPCAPSFNRLLRAGHFPGRPVAARLEDPSEPSGGFAP